MNTLKIGDRVFSDPDKKFGRVIGTFSRPDTQEQVEVVVEFANGDTIAIRPVYLTLAGAPTRKFIRSLTTAA